MKFFSPHCSPSPLGTQRCRKLLFFFLKSGETETKGNAEFTTWPSREGSGAVTFQTNSGSPVLGPLAFGLAAILGKGLDGQSATWMEATAAAWEQGQPQGNALGAKPTEVLR